MSIVFEKTPAGVSLHIDSESLPLLVITSPASAGFRLDGAGLHLLDISQQAVLAKLDVSSAFRPLDLCQS